MAECRCLWDCTHEWCGCTAYHEPLGVSLLFPARYRSECPTCFGAIEEGELIAGLPEGYVCEECFVELS